MNSKDILIVGGGPVGATLALALQMEGVSVTMLEARERAVAHHDQRALALSYGTRIILERLGVWDTLESKATPINTIHISQRGSIGRSRLKAQEHGLPALGYVLSYGALSAALDQALSNRSGVNLIYQAEVTSILPEPEAAQVIYKAGAELIQLHSQLAVLADGGRSLGDIPGIRRVNKQYGHDALVSIVQAESSHGNIAYERFTPMGPIALLPNGPRDFSLVWTGGEDAIAELLTLDDAEFLKRLHEHFGDRVGKFLNVGKRISFPLKLSYLDPVTAPHLVVIGNAAQTMHPVAGQGFNVGLRDAWELAQLIVATPKDVLGESAMLNKYQSGRKTDTQRGLKFTDFLVNVFSNDLVGLSPLRGMSIGLLDTMQPLKQQLVNKMSFGPRG